jgi:hAT family C-terminal dimerisation region
LGERRKKLPNVALAARKWLSVTATSTPIERVFSICGIVNTAIRSSLLGKSIEDQVFLHNNLK